VPYLNLRLSAQPSHDDAARMASALTDLTAEILGKKRELTAVSVETIAPQRWTLGGVPLDGQPVRTFFLEVIVSDGTNSEAEMAEYIARAYAALEALWGPLAPASYIAIHQHPAHAWGYQGRTQASRARTATSKTALGEGQATAAARPR
jgi:4-oxalocrotonate tautomerase